MGRKLKTCPFCGGTPRRTCSVREDRVRVAFVYCESCLATGSTAPSPEAADALWDARATSWREPAPATPPQPTTPNDTGYHCLICSDTKVYSPDMGPALPCPACEPAKYNAARHPTPLTEQQVSVLAGMTRKGGTYRTYRGKLYGLGIDWGTDFGRCAACDPDGKSDHHDARLYADLATARAERDEARDWVRRMHAEAQVLTCVFCGESYPPGTAASGEPALVAHVEKCPKHPIAAFRAERDAARDLLEVQTRRAGQAEARLAQVDREMSGRVAALGKALDAERARADRLSDARQELGVERDMLKMENEQLRASLDTSATEVARLKELLGVAVAAIPSDHPGTYISNCPGWRCTALRLLGREHETHPAFQPMTPGPSTAPVGAPLAGKTKGGTEP